MEQAAWNTIPVFMMDFEGSPSSGVIEYGVVLLQHGAIVETATSLCQPVGEIHYKDQEVHGISSRDLQGLDRFTNNYEQFADYRRRGVFAAHNRHAENNFLKDTWAVPPTVPDWRRGTGEAQEWGPWIDTLAIYKHLYPGLESYALGELIDRFQLREKLAVLGDGHCPPARRKTHCALFDALASSMLLLRLAEEQRLKPFLSLQWLLQFSSGSIPQQELF